MADQPNRLPNESGTPELNDVDPGLDADFPDDDVDDADDLGDDDEAVDAESEGSADTSEPPPEPQRLPPTRVLRQKLSAERKARKQYEQAVQRLARLAGTDVNTLLQQLDVAERMGLAQSGVASAQTQTVTAAPQTTTPVTGQPAGQSTDPTVTALLASGLAYQQALDVRYALELERLRQNPIYADIDKRLPAVRQVAQRYNLSLKQAYDMLYGDDVAQRAAQTALQNAQSRRGLTAERDGGGTIEPTRLGLDEDEFDAAVRMGFDPREYAAMKKATTLDEYERLLNAANRRRGR